VLPFELMLERVGLTIIPISLVSVGAQFQWRAIQWRELRMPIVLGLGFKLLVAPAVFAALYLAVGERSDLAVQVTILEAAMAPMILGSVLAVDFDLEPKLANVMVMVGIPLSLLTVPIWAWSLSF